jgi:hypothetical protein
MMHLKLKAQRLEFTPGLPAALTAIAVSLQGSASTG